MGTVFAHRSSVKRDPPRLSRDSGTRRAIAEHGILDHRFAAAYRIQEVAEMIEGVVVAGRRGVDRFTART